MIAIARRKFGIPINEIFFAQHPASINEKAAVLFFVQAGKPLEGCSPFQTLMVDLTAAEETLSSAISKNTRYKINRAEREGLQPEIVLSPSDEQVKAYADYYDLFARQKSLGSANRRKLHALKAAGALVLTSISGTEAGVLSAHAWVHDQTLQRVRLLYSASHFREMTESADRNLIGRANRCLHWHEILSFKKMGLAQYDFGGLPMNDSDPVLNAIARFKLEFGGCPLIEYTGIVPGNALGRMLLAVKGAIK